MNKEEIRHFKSLLREGSIRHMNILLDDKFQKELQTIIKNYEKLQRENEELKKQYCERTDCSGRIGNSKKVEELRKKIDKAKSLNHEISHTIYEEFLEKNIIGSKFLYERIKKQLSILEDKEV